jgi:hypothetical protein
LLLYYSCVGKKPVIEPSGELFFFINKKKFYNYKESGVIEDRETAAILAQGLILPIPCIPPAASG